MSSLPRPLDRLLRPRSIAIVGASADPRSFGGFVQGNLERAGFAGALHLVSPSVPTGQTAACWIVVTKDGKYAYTTNTGSAGCRYIDSNLNFSINAASFVACFLEGGKDVTTWRQAIQSQ